MNEPSVFQAQYPLSPRKFWKKIIPNLFTYLILSLIPGLAVGYLIYAINYSSGNNNGSLIFGLIILLTIVFYIIFVLLNAWYIKAYIKRYYYDCGEQFITIKKGVFAPTEIHVQYQKIQDVYVDQDILDRMMGLYDVHIASATVLSGIEAHIDGVNFEVAEGLKNLILAKIHGASNPTSQMPVSAQAQPQSNPVQFTQKISSETYPVSGAWVVSMIGGSLLYSIIYTLIFARLLILIGFGYWFLAFGFFFFAHIIWRSIWKKNYY
ncbi:MAG TPA: PH domain-containing protein, partial [Candidatus Paceibacterota bacterium]|nr:PH domain-containing protein [Candidatus Paceibacterota bacterium]